VQVLHAAQRVCQVLRRCRQTSTVLGRLTMPSMPGNDKHASISLNAQCSHCGQLRLDRMGTAQCANHANRSAALRSSAGRGSAPRLLIRVRAYARIYKNKLQPCRPCAKLQSQGCGTVVQATRLPDVCKNVTGCAKRNGDGEMDRPHRCAVPRCPKCSSPSAASRRRFAALRVPCLQRRTCDRQAESSAQTGLGGPIPRQSKYMSLNIDVISRRNSSDCASASLTCAAGSSSTHQNRKRPIGSTVR
jgi:hypothetical protein